MAQGLLYKKLLDLFVLMYIIEVNKMGKGKVKWLRRFTSLDVCGVLMNGIQENRSHQRFARSVKHPTGTSQERKGLMEEIRKNTATKRTKYIDWKGLVVDTLYLRDRGVCQLCNKELNMGDMFEVDHIIEKSDGGKDEMRNLRLVHLVCHKLRHGTRKTVLPVLPYRPVLTSFPNIKKNVHGDILRALQAALTKERNLTKACRLVELTFDQARYYIGLYKLDKNRPEEWNIREIFNTTN